MSIALPEARIHRRDEWGAQSPKGTPTELARSAIDFLAFHYSSMDAERRVDHAGCAGVVRNIQRFHKTTRKWNDIAYSWLVCHHGHAFEGRGWDVMTAATYGVNDRSQAICFLGGDVEGRDDVTAFGREALAALANDAISRYGRGLVLDGHRRWVATSCPGEEIMAWIAAKGWLVDEPRKKPWPIPIPKWFWPWAKWQRERALYPTRAAWMRKRPKAAPTRVPEWAWIRLAAMTPKL